MSAQVRRWTPFVFGAVAVGLLPWALWLSMALPGRHLSEHWDVAWVGFDLMLAGALAATALAAARRSPLLTAAATTAGSLLVVDAWFDVVTASTSRELLDAVVLALLCELPLAGLCFWVAKDGERFYAAARRFRRRSAA